MQTSAAPHHDLGVDHYFWATSPLRRYSDLLNQWQLKAVIEHGVAARLSAPFQNRDAGLLERLVGFENVYANYAAYQRRMEAFWSLRWLQQEAVDEVVGTVLKNAMVLLENVPLSVGIGKHNYAPGTSLRLRLKTIDEVAIAAEAEVVAVLGTQAG
jgi:exoribonuclease-2